MSIVSSSFFVSVQVSHPKQSTGRIVVLYSLIFESLCTFLFVNIGVKEKYVLFAAIMRVWISLPSSFVFDREAPK